MEHEVVADRIAADRSRELGVERDEQELAARYGASVAEETSDWRQAYATAEWFRLERPPSWARLPWS